MIKRWLKSLVFPLNKQEDKDKYCVRYSTTADRPIALHNASTSLHDLCPMSTPSSCVAECPPELLQHSMSCSPHEKEINPPPDLLWEVNKELSFTLIAPSGGAFVASHWLPKVSFWCVVSWCCHIMYLALAGQYQQEVIHCSFHLKGMVWLWLLMEQISWQKCKAKN